MRTLSCKHKIWGENWLYLRPYLKAFPIFNVLETCREYFLTIDLGIVEFIKKIIERFLKKCEIFRHGPNYVQKLYQKQLNASFLNKLSRGLWSLSTKPVQYCTVPVPKTAANISFSI